jgi:hypothetical protein
VGGEAKRNNSSGNKNGTKKAEKTEKNRKNPKVSIKK